MISATPWDSYLIRNSIWTYPENAIIGLTIFKIPMEEIFFFFIQTYNTSLIYSILTKRLVLPCYLCTTATKLFEIGGTIVILCGVLYGIAGFWVGGKHTYMSLILGWLCPLLLIPWYELSRFVLADTTVLIDMQDSFGAVYSRITAKGDNDSHIFTDDLLVDCGRYRIAARDMGDRKRHQTEFRVGRLGYRVSMLLTSWNSTY
jgi:hypothetical protein